MSGVSTHGRRRDRVLSPHGGRSSSHLASSRTAPPCPRRGDPMSAPAQSGTRFGRVVGASVVGTTVEWYDFFLYGSAAALVFGPLFFPEQDDFVGVLAAFA